MNKRFYITIVSCLCAFALCIACSDDEPGSQTVAPDKEEETTNTDDPNKIGYDDGKTLIFNIKIAIDREGLEYNGQDLDWVRENLEKQWEEINYRFKALDKNNKLEREYKFVPDLDDIVLYSKDDVPGHWDVPAWLDEKGGLDLTKYQCMVTYDFFAEPGEGGGGFSGYEGMGSILVVHPAGDNATEFKYTDHFQPEANGVSSIVHELGHFRGNIDTYTHSVSGTSNKVKPGMGFEPESSTMGNMGYNPYDALDRPEGCRSYWNDYELKVMNAVKASTQRNLIYVTMRDYFADGIELIPVEADGETPISGGYSVKFYDATGHQVKTEVLKEFKTEEGGPMTIDAYDLFWHSDRYTYPWAYYDMLFVEVTVESGNGHAERKCYAYLPNYRVHEQGLDDKRNPDFSGRSIYKLKVPVYVEE